MRNDPSVKSKLVYRIIDEKGKHQAAYTRTYFDEYDFFTVNQARESNVHGVYKDKTKYKIAKYRVDYVLIEDDIDPII